MERPDTAGVVAPPPLIFAAALLAGWGLGWLAPARLLPAQAAHAAGGALVLAAAALGGWGLLEMRRAGTAVDPFHPTSALVRRGPYAFSRNPLYLGLMLLSLGVALLLNSPWCLLMLLPAALLLRFGVVAREEAYLARKFGDDYLAYCAEVRRWL